MRWSKGLNCDGQKWLVWNEFWDNSMFWTITSDVHTKGRVSRTVVACILIYWICLFLGFMIYIFQANWKLTKNLNRNAFSLYESRKLKHGTVHGNIIKICFTFPIITSYSAHVFLYSHLYSYGYRCSFAYLSMIWTFLLLTKPLKRWFGSLTQVI